MIRIVVLIVLLVLSGLFSSTETAFISANAIRLRSLAEDGNKKAARALCVLNNTSKMLSAVLIGNNIVNLTASSLTTTIAQNLWGNTAVSIATGILTFAVLIFCEITPKNMATIKADSLAMAYSGYVKILMVVLTPFIFVINKIALGLMYVMGYRSGDKQATVTEDELRTMVDVGHEEGVIESDERKMINNVFDFNDLQAKDIMIPRIDMSCIPATATYEDIIDVYREDKYTRLPVYEETVDNIIGILNVKDLLLIDNANEFDVHNIIRKPYFTYEFKNISELMDELRKTSNNFAIVIDEYGSTVGMITLEDMLEEIVGEIRDEYDDDEEDEIVEISPEEYILSGQVRIDDLTDFINLPPDAEENEEYDSIGGLMISYLGRFPDVGDSVEFDDVTFVVDECNMNRITKVHAYIIHPDEPDEN